MFAHNVKAYFSIKKLITFYVFQGFSSIIPLKSDNIYIKAKYDKTKESITNLYSYCIYVFGHGFFNNNITMKHSYETANTGCPRMISIVLSHNITFVLKNYEYEYEKRANNFVALWFDNCI